MKKRFSSRVVLIGAALIVLGCFAYSRHLQIAATMWHWQNGDFVRVGNYQVPVPRDWLVKVEPYGLTLLIDARPTRNATRNSIMIFPAPLPAGSFEFWISHKKQWLKEHKVTIEEQSLSFESEAVACLGGNELMQRWDATDTTSLECWSSGQLRLIFIGQRPGLQVLYSIIPKIRRVPQALPSQPKDSTR